jgi:Na+:H+ antiporter, NhaA family
MLERAEHAVAPWVHFGVAPVFAFANAGVSLTGVTLATALAPIPLGIAAGLFIGKQLGIFASTWAAVRLGFGDLPAGAGWRQVYGVAILGGIGFTMSLFIGTLAFPDPAYAAPVRVGVLLGSFASAFAGYGLLRWSAPAPSAGESAGPSRTPFLD